MHNKSVRMWGAWVIGIFSAALISLTIVWLLNSIGIITSFGTDNLDIDNTHTFAEGAIGMISTMFASRIGMAIYTKKLNGGVSKRGNLLFIALIVIITAMGVIDKIFFYLTKDMKSSDFSEILDWIEGIIAIGIFWITVIWFGKENEKLDLNDRK